MPLFYRACRAGGQDVPSASSEFAHPDVIIGMTVLAYRYSGLRKEDFNDLIDAMTSQFQAEIGPARDRASSKRHEQWVLAAGGKIRGLKNGSGSGSGSGGAAAAAAGKGGASAASKQLSASSADSKSNASAALRFNEGDAVEVSVDGVYYAASIVAVGGGSGGSGSGGGGGGGTYDVVFVEDGDKEVGVPVSRIRVVARTEVVQLKFLQKSNREQMSKLFELFMMEPRVIHYYLKKTIFPGALPVRVQAH
jgi:hypothetical protein